MSPYRPKKRLGQNFLADEAIAESIVKAIDPQPDDHVVEIGPGQGALTKYLLAEKCYVTAIEFDRDLLPILKSNIGNKPNLIIIAADIMKVAVDDLPENAKLIGNLPYNISTAVIERLYDFKTRVKLAVFTVQAEVAARLAASPGCSDYGSLTVIMQAGFEISTLFDIPPHAFNPAPQVVSSVIKIAPIEREMSEFENFKTFIRGCFRQKRKTLVNSMEIGLNIPKDMCESLIGNAGHKSDVRAEQLGFDEFMRLYELWRAT